jgi:chromosome segregation ATPase
MQDLAAECLEMERGVSGSLTRLEAVEFKIKKKEEDLKILEERYSQLQKELESKKAEDLIVKESDFLGFQKIKMGKTIENYKKAIKTNNIQLLKNKTELEFKEKQIAELKTKIESLKKEVSFFKSKNSALLTNETVFAVEKKKYLDSVENTLKKAILQESIKIPNLRNLNDTERKDKILQIIEKISKENNIPVSAFEEVFGDSKKSAQFFKILSRENNEQEQKWVVKSKR